MNSTSSSDTSVRSLATTAAPLVALGTTWVVRKAAMKTYESATGKPAPVVANREAPMLARVLWAAGMAAVVAGVEILVWRLLDESAS